MATFTTRPTRYPELGHRQDARDCWRFVDRRNDASVGPQYPTKAELLADLERYATLFGCAEQSDTAPPITSNPHEFLATSRDRDRCHICCQHKSHPDHDPMPSSAHRGKAHQSDDMGHSERSLLEWMVDLAERRDDNKRARTIILKFSAGTLRTWRDRALDALASNSLRREPIPDHSDFAQHMLDVVDTLRKLPKACLVRLPDNGEVVLLRRGVRGYHPTDTELTPEAFNAQYGISEAQVRAMLIGSRIGWDSPWADPDTQGRK